jgi:hypothetical protein
VADAAPQARAPVGWKADSARAVLHAEHMSEPYTKDGVPLTVRGDSVYNPAGENFGPLMVGSDFRFNLKPHNQGLLTYNGT